MLQPGVRIRRHDGLTKGRHVSAPPDRSLLTRFLRASSYTDPVDVKKLTFVLSAVLEYARGRGRPLDSLHILEAACGTGGITVPLTSLGCRVKAFDIDRAALETLRAEIERKGIGNLTIALADARTFDDGNLYDIVIASEVLEHVLEPALLLANLVKRMSKGSCLIVTTPNGFGPWELKNRLSPVTRLKRWNTLRRVLRRPPYIRGTGVDHCQFFNRRRLTRMFTALGLRVVRAANSDGLMSVIRPLRTNRLTGTLDTRLADLLPFWMASGWYFLLEMGNSSSDPAR